MYFSVRIFSTFSESILTGAKPSSTTRNPGGRVVVAIRSMVLVKDEEETSQVAELFEDTLCKWVRKFKYLQYMMSHHLDSKINKCYSGAGRTLLSNL